MARRTAAGIRRVVIDPDTGRPVFEDQFVGSAPPPDRGRVPAIPDLETVLRVLVERIDPNETLTVDQVANYLNLSPNHVRRLIQQGKIPSLRLGRRIIVPRLMLAYLVNGHAA